MGKLVDWNQRMEAFIHNPIMASTDDLRLLKRVLLSLKESDPTLPKAASIIVDRLRGDPVLRQHLNRAIAQRLIYARWSDRLNIIQKRQHHNQSPDAASRDNLLNKKATKKMDRFRTRKRR